VRVYGLGDRPAEGRLSFHAISEGQFVEDLASCAALVATAGNQLVGEALFLGKPCFVMPEARNFEQFINAHFLAQTGAGSWMELERVTPAALHGFVSRMGDFAACIDRRRLDGLPLALRVLERFLPTPLSAIAGGHSPISPIEQWVPEPTA
jgi:UDP:flavonoid glycosyltransferase YjiC (YdhE family)